MGAEFCLHRVDEIGSSGAVESMTSRIILTSMEGFAVALSKGHPGEWVPFERELIDASVAIPLQQRTAWAEAHHGVLHWHLSVRNPQGEAEVAALVAVHRSRTVPGWRILQVARVGSALTFEGWAALMEAMCLLPDLEPRVLRLQIEVFALESDQLASLTETMLGFGFGRDLRPRSYRQTALLNLSPSQEELFSGIHRTARRHVRAVAKNPVRIQPIEDVELAPRLDQLMHETFSRSDGAPPEYDWPALIDLSARHPGLSRIVGLFREGGSGGEALLAFAWGRGNGDHAVYGAAASTRKTQLRIPLTYGLMWDLIVWAKDGGARFFDLGGVVSESAGTDEAVGRISRFKRRFAPQISEVASEFQLEPHPRIEAFSKVVGDLARFVSSPVRRLVGRSS